MIPDICSICNSPRSDSAGPCVVCGAAPTAPARNLPVGTHLQNGKYTLGRVLGEGGFGITYQGAHRHLKRTVAIKELFPDGAVRHGVSVSVSERQRRDFHMEKESVLEEARIISRLNSPHIVEVHDVFLENNTAYIVMEYLEGQSLQERIEAEGPLPLGEVHRIAIAACDALIEVHKQDLLHRDIKPANIMLTNNGRVVLVDFGSARVFNHGQTVRHTRILTMDYAAPEMYSTQARFGPYTDLFCLGGTLFHALTGSQPPSFMDRLQGGSVDLEFPDALQGPFCAAIRQVLQIAVEDRPQSAAVFKSICSDFAKDKAASVPPIKKLWDPDTIILRSTMYGHTDLVNDIVFSPDGKTLASSSADKTIRLWDVATSTLRRTIHGHTDLVNNVVFSPDGKTLASSSADKTVRLWDVATGTSYGALDMYPSVVFSVAFSPDGQILASGGSDKTVCLWDVATGTLRRTIYGHTDLVNNVVFSPDGEILASSSADKTVRLWDVTTGTSYGALDMYLSGVFSVVFSPDGRTLVSRNADDTLSLWDTAKGTFLRTLGTPTEAAEVFTGLAFSPDGQTLATSGSNLYLWDVVTGTSIRILDQLVGNGVAFSPDGQILASGIEMTLLLWE